MVQCVLVPCAALSFVYVVRACSCLKQVLCVCACLFWFRGATMSRDTATLTWAVHNFVSAASLLMRELRSVGRNQLSVTHFRWLVLCLRSVIATLAGIDPSEPTLLSTSGDVFRQLESDAYWAD